MTTSDPDDIQRMLREWLRPRLEIDGPTPTDLGLFNVGTPDHGGMSNETILFDAGWKEDGEQRGLALVAKLEPSGPALFPTYDPGREAAILRALAEYSDVPVPEVVGTGPDPGTPGRPFFVMKKLAGSIPADDPPYFLAGWLHDATAEEQRSALDGAVDTMARIHALDPQVIVPGPECDSADLPGAAGLDQDLAYWRRYLDWLADDSPAPLLEAALAWCEDQRPQDPRPDTLCWGDARMGNLVFGPDYRVTGVLDWEMAGPGAPETDLGWFLFAHDTALMWMEDLPGFRDRDGLLARYTNAAGREPRDLHWYEVWAGVRATAIHLRSLRLRGAEPDGETPLMASLRRLVDLP